MDQIKIGKFIAERRKNQNLTQLQLAEQLHITDRAVSKWENGRSMPDAAIMLDLCKILKISVNDLLCGEVVTMENYNKENEKNLLEMVKQKEESDKRLLFYEAVLGIISSLFFFTTVIVGAVLMKAEQPLWIFLLLVGVGLLQFVAAMILLLRIEQTTGYYECAACGHRYVPSYKSVTLAMHMGRTRYMKCPVCGKKSWQKKVVGETTKTEK